MLQIYRRNHRVSIHFVAFACLCLVSLTAYGQSLGDIARENREKQAEDSPKVITNANLPKNPDGYTAPSADETKAAQSATRADAASDRKAAQQTAAQQRIAAQWRQRIQTQEFIVAAQQERVDTFRSGMPEASVANGIPANRYQVRLRQMQQQLEQQKLKLEDMRDAARRAGMHTTTYEP